MLSGNDLIKSQKINMLFLNQLIHKKFSISNRRTSITLIRLRISNSYIRNRVI